VIKFITQAAPQPVPIVDITPTSSHALPNSDE
jgi:hypothetical protein